jgi:hypothetical protein
MSVALSPIGGAGAQFFDNNGVPLAGGKLYTYDAGTTTPQVTYTSIAGTTANSNPIILNAAGRVSGEVWLTSNIGYKFILKTSTDVLLGTWDNIYGYSSGSLAYAATEVQTATAGQTLFVLSSMYYNPGTNTLAVYVDGVNQVIDNAYVESTSTSVTFMSGLHLGALVKFVNLNAASVDASTVSYAPGGTGAVATTVQAKLRESVSVMDFGAVGDGVTDDTAAINAALNASRNVTVPQGGYLITSTIVIPPSKRLIFDVTGGTASTLPTASFIKSSSMTTHAIQVSSGATLENGQLVCQIGNTGDGVVLAGNSARVLRFAVRSAGRDGFSVATDVDSTNLNNCEIFQCYANGSGRYGLFINDSRNVPPDANLITVTQFFAQSNISDGIRLGHCNWVTLLNCLTEVNGGYGLYISNTIKPYDTVAEAKYHTIVGGDFNESNTNGSFYFGGYQCVASGGFANQNIVFSGLRNSFISGGVDTEFDRLNTPQVKFPSVQVPSADVNTLDDYEEGTFTPVLIGLTTAGVGTYSTQLGIYTKIGNVVNYAISLIWTAHTGTGGMRITGLPFVPSPLEFNNRFSAAITWNELVYTATPMAFINGQLSSVYLRQAASNSTATDIPMDTQASIWITGSYLV